MLQAALQLATLKSRLYWRQDGFFVFRAWTGIDLIHNFGMHWSHVGYDSCKIRQSAWSFTPKYCINGGAKLNHGGQHQASISYCLPLAFMPPVPARTEISAFSAS